MTTENYYARRGDAEAALMQQGRQATAESQSDPERVVAAQAKRERRMARNRFNGRERLQCQGRYVESTFFEDPCSDPTPWCTGCGAMAQADCHCGPIAEND